MDAESMAEMTAQVSRTLRAAGCSALVLIGSCPGASGDVLVDGASVSQGKVGQVKVGQGKTGPMARDVMTMEVFLDRLMMAESGGRDDARNARSTALGPYQFIVSTFLSVARRHFPSEVEKLSPGQILALRTNRKFARKAAEAYTRDNATSLATAGHKPTFPHLRLAFLLGPGGADRVLSAKPKTSLRALLGLRVIRANPFMARMTAADLIKRAARDISVDPGLQAGVAPRAGGKRRKSGPRIRVRCNLGRASCRRWLALKKRRLARRSAHRKRTK